MLRLASTSLLAAALIGIGVAASAAPATRHAASDPHHGRHDPHDRHTGHHLGHRHHIAPTPTTSAPVPAAHHSRVVTFVDGYVQPVPPTPYPFDGKLAGDGILRTGIMDSNVLRAFGVVPN